MTIDNGIITANSTNFDKNFIGKNNSKTVLTADEYLHNTIKGLVTFSETSSASFKNIDIDYTGTSSNSITLEGTSSLVIENAVINKNIDTTTGTNITFVGNTHFKDNSTLPKSFVLKQKNNVILKLKNIPAYTGTDTGNSKLAAIELENPSYNLVVMEGAEGQDLTQEIVERFEIHNPGYYLAFDSQSKKGVVKLSSIKIEEPTFGGCSIEINGNISFGQNGIGLLGRADTDQEIRVTARDSDGNALNVTSVKQYLGATMISDATETPETEKTIQFKRSELETYGLEIRFMYKQIEYGTMLTVKIQ